MKQKRMTARRRSALRWLAALCLLALFCIWTGLYGLTPQSALRRQGRDYYLEEMTLVDSVDDGHGTDFGVSRILAAENGGYLLLGQVRWTPWRGWQPGAAYPVERTDGAVDALAVCYSWDFEEDFYPHLVFGRVNDRRVAQVTLQKPDGQRVEASLRTGRDGRRYFLAECTGGRTLLADGLKLAALDEQGEILEEQALLPGVLLQ